MTDKEIKDRMSDRWWRLNNLYYIKDKTGKKVLFKPNAIQKLVHDNLWFFSIVPKARQLGITTFFVILYFDQVLFSENITAAIIAHKKEDMQKIFRNKIKFAWQNLHPWLKNYIGDPEIDSANELKFSNGSSISVSMSTRSGTVQFLHISEFGYICQKFPEKAEEIVTGAINSVDPGQVVSIESTAAGREGYFYEYCMEALRMQKEKRKLTELDFKLFFFPWWADPSYRLKANFALTSEDMEYFSMLKDKHGIKLDEEQMRWYVKKKKINKDKMYAEYPSTIDEAFSVQTEGSYYQKDMARVYLERRIRPIPHDPMLDVQTWWDLGLDDYTVILLTQMKGREIRFIDMYWNRGEPLSHYYNWLKERKDKMNYRYSRHYLPHDVEVTELQSNKTRHQTLIELGMNNIHVCPKDKVQDGIDQVRRIFPRFYFDEEKCAKLHESLFNYRKDFDKKMGVFKDRPRKDENAHFADPVRYLAMNIIDYGNSDNNENKGPQYSSFFS